MKANLLFIFVCLICVLSSCSKDGDLEKLEDEIVTLSGTFKLSDLPRTINFNGTEITFELMDTVSRVQTKAASDWRGPFYVSSEPFEAYTKQKIVLNSSSGLATGVYVCDVWLTMGKIVLPVSAYAGKIGMPNPAGYSDYSHQEKGVNWSISTTNKGIQINWSFNTLVVKSDMAGRRYHKVLPIDGAMVKVPYYYMAD
ncbi:hypothetical protein [Parabacteroides gordonii]|uniref:hypothetical protein n=1 Tax=Parabacteroides gordonii TaxID=574930 RepID=UPI0026ECB383|nr:hypothetical protein [Parabacteroides gordonii]